MWLGSRDALQGASDACDALMSDQVRPLPSRVVEFIARNVTSLLQLEALLLVFEGGRRTRTAAQLAAEMYVPAGAMADWLDDFVVAGYCERRGDEYCIPESPEVYELLADVADCYVRRRISVSRLVFGATARDARAAFSDAFRIQKDP